MDKVAHYLFDIIIEYLIRIIGCIMCLTILMQIFTRIVFKVPFSWTDELARFSFIWYCFLGSTLTMYKKLHLGIDYFESKMSPKRKNLNRIFVYSVEILFGLFLAFYGFKLLGVVGLQKSPIMRIRIRYIYLSLPISGILYMFLGIWELEKQILSKQAISQTAQNT